MKHRRTYGASLQTKVEADRLFNVAVSGDWPSARPYRIVKVLRPIHNQGAAESPSWGFAIEVEETVTFLDWILGI